MLKCLFFDLILRICTGIVFIFGSFRLFDHQIHQAVTGYGISCGDCHHTLAEDEYDQVESCVECHDPDEGDEEVPKLADAFHQQCGGCHEDFGAGPVEKDCAACHVM